MNKCFFAVSVLALFFSFVSCTPDDKNNGDTDENQSIPIGNNNGESDGNQSIPIGNNNGESDGNQSIPVESVSLDRPGYAFHVIGNSITLNATVLPIDATDKSVEWSCDKEDVATVDTSGVVTAKGNGKATITVKTKDQGKKATCVVIVAQWVTGFILDKTWLPLEVGDEATLSVEIVFPVNANDKSYTWSSSDDVIASVDNNGIVKAKSKGTATIKVMANDGSGVNNSCQVAVYSIDIPQAIDMGTVVNGKNIKWASFNIGASSPEEYGLYYAWGETEPKSRYLKDTYKFGKDYSDSFSKYNTNSSYGTVDNKTVLESEDDVAYVKSGGKWRMPTDAEWTALREQCTWVWTTRNSIEGCLVTAPSGNSIFLPGAGQRLANFLYGAGAVGNYWSSSLVTDYPNNAWLVKFDPENVFRYPFDRLYGFSVRPVSE